jgi:hypothetical protein
MGRKSTEMLRKYRYRYCIERGISTVVVPGCTIISISNWGGKTQGNTRMKVQRKSIGIEVNMFTEV